MIDKINVNDPSGINDSYSINESFSEQVDEVLNGTFDKSNLLFVSNLPDRLKEVFGNDYPLLMTSKHVDTVYHENGRYKANYHGLGELIKQVPDALKEPVMIVTNPSKILDSAIVVTELKDKQNNTIIVPIEVGVKGYYNNVQIDANQINTIFGKSNFNNFIDKITPIDILFINKEKAAELYKVQGRQLPNQLNNINGFIHSVRKSNQKVNYESKGNYKSDMQIALEKAGLLQDI